MNVDSPSAKSDGRKGRLAAYRRRKPQWYSKRHEYRALLRRKRECFWQVKIEAEKSKPGKQWRSIDALLGRGKLLFLLTVTLCSFIVSLMIKLLTYNPQHPTPRLRLFHRFVSLRCSVSSCPWLLIMSLQQFVHFPTKPVHSTHRRRHILGWRHMGSKTGANFRLRFSESKIGTGFRPQKSAPIFDSENRRGQKSDDDAVENRNKIKKCNRNVY